MFLAGSILAMNSAAMIWASNGDLPHTTTVLHARGPLKHALPSFNASSSGATTQRKGAADDAQLAGS